MKRTIIPACIALWLAPAASHALEQSLEVLVELPLDHYDATRSWTDRGLGKLGGGTADDSITTGANLRVALAYGLQVTDTIGAHLVLDWRAGRDSEGGFTEGWLTWKPVPTSPLQHAIRGGAYIPPFSLEHTHTGWTSPWMPTASVLNSWVGEELHVTGVEYTLRRVGAMTHSPNTFTLRTGVFGGNDTAGTVLSWRGWVTNDRVTPRGNTIPLPVRAAFLPGGTFPGPKNSDPFVDLDDRVGYYLAGEWRRGDRFRLSGARYDNRADPRAFADGQAGWRTRFHILGLHVKAASNLDLLAQYAAGNTFVGRFGTQFSVDNDFAAGYLLVRKTIDRHELAARVERFRVTDEDPNTLDDNRESGHAWAASWQYHLASHDWTLGLEYLQIRSRRPERALLGLHTSEIDRQLRLLLRLDLRLL